MQVVVDTVVETSGAGTVTVSVGFDEAALARVGDPGTQLQIQDLRVAGWEVTDSSTGADGITWIRASKPFGTPAAMSAVLAEIAGPETFFSQMAFQRTETDDDITYTVTGQVDLSNGVATFSDPELAAQLGGDPFGGNLAAIEAEEGRPIEDMVTFEINTQVAGGAVATVRPTLADAAPQAIAASTVEVKPASPLVRIAIGAAIVLALVIAVVALAGVRRRVNAR